MNSLSNIYKNHSKEIYTGKKYCIVEENMTEETFLKMFPNISSYYQKKLRIITKNKNYDTYIYQKDKDGLLTIQNERIPFTDILSIEVLSDY